MGRAKHLTKAEKETIAYLHKRKYPVGKIARLVGRNRRSVNRYKKYTLPGKTKDVHTMYTQKKTPDASMEQFRVEDQDLFKRMYTDFVNYHWFEKNESQIFANIKHRYWEKHFKKITKWPKYRGWLKTNIIIDLRDMLIKKYSNEGV